MDGGFCGRRAGGLRERGAGAADCGMIDQAVRQAMQAGEVERYSGLLLKAQAEATCTSAYRARLARVLALSAYRKLTGANRNPSAADLETVATLATPWQVMISLGDAYYDARDYPRPFAPMRRRLTTCATRRPIRKSRRPTWSVTPISAPSRRGAQPDFPCQPFGARRAIGPCLAEIPQLYRRGGAGAVGFAFNSADLTPDGIAPPRKSSPIWRRAGMTMWCSSAIPTPRVRPSTISICR